MCNGWSIHLLFTTILVWIVSVETTNAKTPSDGNNKEALSIQSFHIIHDSGKSSLDQILRLIDHSKKISDADTVIPKQVSNYWIKLSIENRSNYDTFAILKIFPSIHNTLYQFNQNSKKWESSENGLESNEENKRNTSEFLVHLSKGENMLLVNMQLEALQNFEGSLKAEFQLQDVTQNKKNEQVRFIIWIITIIVLTVYSLYSFAVYLLLKDKIYLLYLIMLVGGIIYVTSIGKYFNLITDIRYVAYHLNNNNSFYYLDQNGILARISAAIIFFGLTQLTRTYLETKKLFPTWDRLLIYSVYGYVAFVFTVLIVVICGFFKADYYTNPLQNICAIFLILLMFAVAIRALKSKDNRSPRYYLIANSMSLAIVLISAGYFTIFNVRFMDSPAFYLPNLCVISQAITFAIALVARYVLVRDQLTKKEMEAWELQNVNDKIQLNNQLLELESEQMMAEIALEKSKGENLQLNLEIKQRELISSTLHTSNTNEMMVALKKEVDLLYKRKKNTPEDLIQLKKIREIIQNNLMLDSNWDSFKLHFEQVHPDFFRNLKEKHPNLTPNEIRLCAYMHLNLSAKEIASLQNIDPSSVHRAKTRLNKKIHPGTT